MKTTWSIKNFVILKQILKSKIITTDSVLPIQFLRAIKWFPIAMLSFTSSGTTGMITSKHLVTDVTLYEESYRKGFSEFYGNIEDYVVLALLLHRKALR
jgi:hypothetical protein